MKILQYIILIFLFTATACKKDNYEAPSSTFSGRLVYNGSPIGLEYDRVSFELYQPGFGRTGPISGTFDQDGNYSTLLFNGNYKFIIPANQGPFMWNESSGRRDTLAVAINGSQTLDIEVTPYYLIRNANFAAAGGKMNATFSIEKIINDVNARDVERVTLFINKTQFVSGTDNINIGENDPAIVDGAAITDPSGITITDDIPAISPVQNYVFARIGLKIAGVEDLIFSPVIKVTY